jgi:hypothetical protein
VNGKEAEAAMARTETVFFSIRLEKDSRGKKRLQPYQFCKSTVKFQNFCLVNAREIQARITGHLS